MRKTIIHINQHVIKANLKEGKRDPVITVKNGQDNTYAHSVDILDKDGTVVARILYRPDNPLSCGARVWIETYAGLILQTERVEFAPAVDDNACSITSPIGG